MNQIRDGPEGYLEAVDCDVVVAMRGWRENMATMRVGTNLWHLDLGLRFPGVVGVREACDCRLTGPVSAWKLRIRGVVGRVSELAKVCPRENGASV